MTPSILEFFRVFLNTDVFFNFFYFFSADALVASIIGSGPSSSLKREHSEAEENDDDSDEDEEKDTKKLKIDKVDEDKEALSLVEAAPRITIHTLDTPDSCTHEVAVPPNQDYVPLKNPTGKFSLNFPLNFLVFLN